MPREQYNIINYNNIMYVYTQRAAVGEIIRKHRGVMCRPKSSSRKRSLLYYYDIGVGWADTTDTNIIIYNNNNNGIEVVALSIYIYIYKL